MVSYDPEVDIAVLYVAPGQVSLEGGEEVAPGVILHYDREGRLAQIELLEAAFAPVALPAPDTATLPGFEPLAGLLA